MVWSYITEGIHLLHLKSAWILLKGLILNLTPGRELHQLEQKEEGLLVLVYITKFLFLGVLICLVDVLVKFMTKRQTFGQRLQMTLLQDTMQVPFVSKEKFLWWVNLGWIRMTLKERHYKFMMLRKMNGDCALNLQTSVAKFQLERFWNKNNIPQTFSIFLSIY